MLLIAPLAAAHPLPHVTLGDECGDYAPGETECSTGVHVATDTNVRAFVGWDPAYTGDIEAELDFGPQLFGPTLYRFRCTIVNGELEPPEDPCDWDPYSPMLDGAFTHTCRSFNVDSRTPGGYGIFFCRLVWEGPV